MRGAVTQAATAVGALHGASVLLPTMLGGEGPRTYVLAMQNNAELRSSGGIIGSIALLRAENGKVTLQRQASTRDFPAGHGAPAQRQHRRALRGPPRPLSAEHHQHPRFPGGRADHRRPVGRAVRGKVDGVIAVDAVVAAHLMRATGDLSFGPFTATAETVTDLLLSEIYAAIPDPAAQDAIFAQAAGGLFSAALSHAEPQALVRALADAAGEGRIRIWSAHEAEESLLAASALGGAMPQDDEDAAVVGVLMNDGTGGKMDYYTRASIATAVGTCGGVPTTQVRVTWSNTAPPTPPPPCPRTSPATACTACRPAACAL